MTCQTCGDSNSNETRAIWRKYRSTLYDIEKIAEVQVTLRSFYSPGDDWTETDDKIGCSMDLLTSVVGTLVDLAAEYKAEHSAAVDSNRERLVAEAAAAEATDDFDVYIANEAKAAESAE